MPLNGEQAWAVEEVNVSATVNMVQKTLGVYKNKAVQGWLGTMSESSPSLRIMKYFTDATAENRLLVHTYITADCSAYIFSYKTLVNHPIELTFKTWERIVILIPVI